MSIYLLTNDNSEVQANIAPVENILPVANLAPLAFVDCNWSVPPTSNTDDLGEYVFAVYPNWKNIVSGIEDITVGVKTETTRLFTRSDDGNIGVWQYTGEKTAMFRVDAVDNIVSSNDDQTFVEMAIFINGELLGGTAQLQMLQEDLYATTSTGNSSIIQMNTFDTIEIKLRRFDDSLSFGHVASLRVLIAELR